MCGIAGKFNFDGKPVEGREIEAMINKLKHRGPDDGGIFVSTNVGLGHRRLSIIDLSPLGHQPMSDDSKNFWITFNGEIYNYLQLRLELENEGVKFKSNSDTEVIIYLYKKLGVRCLLKLRGMFAFAIYDKTKNELFIARDRIGKKPLKYFYDNKTFVFASELKAFIDLPEISKKIDYEAITQYLQNGYVPAPLTGFKNIYKLQPAHYMIIESSGKVTTERYWDINFNNKFNLSENDWENEILNKIKDSVSCRMIADVPLGAHLSGGVDSSLVVALMAEVSKKPIKTYAVGFKDAANSELAYAKMVADRYHTDHTEIIVEPNFLGLLPSLALQYEEPFADSSAFPTWYLTESTRQGITVALNGDGGDELFGGYNRYQAMAIYQTLKHFPGLPLIANYLNKPGVNRAKEILYLLRFAPYEAYQHIVGIFSIDEIGKLLPQIKLNVKKIDFNVSADNFFDKILYEGLTTHLPGGLIPKVDIASMAHALEVRSPLLDHELLELTARMPAHLKFTMFRKKILLKKIARRYLPHQCIERPKQGFDSPLKLWLTENILAQIKKKLTADSFLKIGLDKTYIENIFLATSNRQTEKKLWTLIMLAEWHGQYFS